PGGEREAVARRILLVRPAIDVGATRSEAERIARPTFDAGRAAHGEGLLREEGAIRRRLLEAPLVDRLERERGDRAPHRIDHDVRGATREDRRVSRRPEDRRDLGRGALEEVVPARGGESPDAEASKERDDRHDDEELEEGEPASAR